MLCRISSDCVATSNPPTVARPDVGASNPHKMRIVVDLPAPLGPRKPKTSPCATSSETLSTATKSPKRLTRFSRRTAGPGGLGYTVGLVTLGFFLMKQRHENFLQRGQDRVHFALPFARNGGWPIPARPSGPGSCA